MSTMTPAGPTQSAADRPTPPRTNRRRLPVAAYLLIVPAILLLLLALGYPIGWQVVTSFQEFGLKQQFGRPPEFIGFDNYKAILTDSTTWSVVVRSVLFCIATAFVTMIVGGGLALLMQRLHRAVRLVLQLALLLAWAMPVIAAMTVWIWMFDWRRGVVNWLLTAIGLDFTNHNWLENPLTFFLIAGIIITWMSVPFVSFSVYAGLTQVSSDVIEAAEIDGATGVQRLRYVVLPLIRPVLMIVLLLQLIWDLRVFAQIKMLQDAGGLVSQTDVLGTYIYRLGTGSSDFGMAAAVSVFVLVLTIVLSSFYVRRLMKEDS